MRAVQLQALLCLIIFTFTTKLHSFTLKRLLDVLNHKIWESGDLEVTKEAHYILLFILT